MSTEVLITGRRFLKDVNLLDSEKPRSITEKYFVQNIHSIQKAVECVYSLCAYSNTFAMHVYFYVNRKSVLKVINEMQELVESRMNRPYFVRYADTEKKITKLTRAITILISGASTIVLLDPFLIASIFQFQPDRLSYAFKATYPFEEHSLVGFLLGATAQCLAAWKFCASFCAINTFYFAVSWYVETLINDIKSIFKQIDLHLMECNDDDEDNDTNLKRSTIRSALVEAVEFHKRIIEFNEHFAKVMDGIIFFTFSFGTVWLSSTWFTLSQYTDLNFVLVFQMNVSNILIMLWLFIYCFFGNLISWKCGEIGDFAYHSTFYKYPTDLKLFTSLIMARSQRPFFITGYQITRCSLESYGKFVNRAFSIYMLFRNVSK